MATANNETLHCAPLNSLSRRVNIYSVVEGEGDSGVPFPNEAADVFLVKDTPGNIVAWPTNLIEWDDKVTDCFRSLYDRL